jgi:hypothetical protein
MASKVALRYRCYSRFLGLGSILNLGGQEGASKSVGQMQRVVFVHIYTH